MNRKQTSPKVATKASKVLSDGRTSANSKSCAASTYFFLAWDKALAAQDLELALVLPSLKTLLALVATLGEVCFRFIAFYLL